MSIRITVAICTWNRAALLRQTLETLARLVVPSDLRWELLVVNNGSTDDTEQVVASFRDRLPVQCLSEPEQGLSHARNRAVAAAHGEYIVWADDDVLVRPNWLSEYQKAFQRWPTAVLFGGPVLPRYAARPPAWLEQLWPRVAGFYAVRNVPPEAQPISGDYLPNGANYALRTAVQRQHLYRPELGRKGTMLYGGEEWQVMSAVLNEGGLGRWVPGAAVEHWLPSERLTTAYLRRIMRCQGEVAPRMGLKSGPLLFGRPVQLWRKVVLSELRYRWHRTRSGPHVWFPLFQRASFLQGQFRGYRTASVSTSLGASVARRV